jgi:hypothetical protein
VAEKAAESPHQSLETLYILAVAPEVASRIVEGRARNLPPDELERSIEDAVLVRTALLAGLTRKDGGSLSEMLTSKVRNSRIAKELASRATTEWASADRATLIPQRLPMAYPMPLHVAEVDVLQVCVQEARLA